MQTRRVLRWAVPAVTGVAIGAAIEAKKPFWNRFTVFVQDQWNDSLEEKNILRPKVVEPKISFPPLMTDAIFDTTDNLLVFMFASEEMRLMQRDRVDQILHAFFASQGVQNLSNVKVYYSIVPPHDGPALIDMTKLQVMCYKGQRKLKTAIEPEAAAPIEEWSEFFAFKSTPVSADLELDSIKHITGDQFESEILEQSKSHPILLQLYEKSCFLCFLMRPFLNSIAELIRDKVELKRLDIEENDFPLGLPVVRGTPTFVLYPNGTRYEEFKPKDLVRRLVLDYKFSDDVVRKMHALVDRVALRFQLFSGTVMWNTESEKILDFLADKDIGKKISLVNAEERDKIIFNRMVADMMSDDMLKVDKLDENIVSLNKELTAAERHALVMAQMLADKVLVLEAKESRNSS